MPNPTEQMEVEEEVSRQSPERARQSIERTAHSKARRAAKRKAQRLKDLALVIGVTLASAVLATLIDASEGFYGLTRKWESWEFDDILLASVALAVCLAWFSYRRWKEALLEIAEREQVENALHESEERWRRLVESHPEPILISIKEEIAYTNEAGVKVLGASSPEALLGRSIFDFPDPELHETFRERLALVTRGNPTPPLEHKIVRLDGEERYIESFSVPIVYQGQQAAQAVIRDVTERRQAEEMLLERQTRLELLSSISTGITAGMPADQIIERTVKLISDHFPTLRVAYSAIDEQGHMTVIHSVEPPGMASITGLTTDLSMAPAYLGMLRRHEPFIVVDVTREDRLDTSQVTVLDAGGTRAMLDVPLSHSDRAVGVLCFDAPAPRTWSDHERTTLMELADYLSVALKDAFAEEGRRRAEQALQESEERFALAVRGSNDGLWDWPDMSVDKSWWAPRFYELLGYEDGEFEASIAKFEELLHPDDLERAREARNLHLETRQPLDVEYRLLTKSGAYRWFLARGQVLWDDTGQPVRMAGSIRDITERKRAEEALYNSEERFQAVATSSHDIVCETDETGKLIYLSPNYPDLLGYKTEQRLNKSLFEHIHPDDQPLVRAEFEKTVRGLSSGLVGFRAKHKNGEWRYIEASGRMFRNRNGEIHGVAVLRDATERKRAEEALQRFSHKLVEAQEAERLRIARELHDEIGQLLTGINISLQTAQRVPGIATLLPHLEDIVSAVVHALQQVHDLALDLRPSLLDDLGLVPGLRSFFKRYTAQANVEVDFHNEIPRSTRFAPEVEITAFRIIQEGLTNVARHAGVRAVQVLVHRESENLVLHVIDQGRGFDSTTALARRESLGLSGMQERASLVGGSLKIESAPGTGTRVSATLPLG